MKNQYGVGIPTPTIPATEIPNITDTKLSEIGGIKPESLKPSVRNCGACAFFDEDSECDLAHLYRGQPKVPATWGCNDFTAKK